jgi:hypothetical protein
MVMPVRGAPPCPRDARRHSPCAAIPTMTFLFHAHSGLRYLVLIAGIAAVAYFAFALATGRTAERPARILTAMFVGFLDLQIVLGLLLMVAGIFYGALMGHLVMMLLAAAAAHGASVMARRSADPRRALQIRLAGVVVALLLIVGGVMAIGRSVFGSGAPSVLI